MEHAKVMVSLQVVAGSSENLMAGGSRVLAAKLELVMLCMLRSEVFGLDMAWREGISHFC
jgi:hypothetical protein